LTKLDQKILIIAGCSKKKLNHAAPAIELNQGQLFKSIKKLVSKNNFDLKILSGKYGLLDGHEVIEPYNEKITKKQDIIRVRKKIITKISQIWRSYDEIIIIMGKNYREVLEPFFDKKFIIIFDRRGIFGYLNLLSHYNNITKKQFLQEIEKFRVIECANFIWSMWDFDGIGGRDDVNRPHCCSYCHYHSYLLKEHQFINKLNNKCKFSKIFPELYKKNLEDIRFIKNLSVQNKLTLMDFIHGGK